MSGAFAGAETISRLSRALNLAVHRHPSGLKYYIQLPGFSYNDFDRKGHVNIWKLIRMFETERMENLNNQQLLAAFAAGRAPMMLCQSTVVSNELYSRAKLHQPMKMTFGLTEIGTSAVVFKQTLIDERDEAVLSTSLRKVVAVDLSTRKSAKLPSEFVENANKFIASEEPSDFKLRVVSPLTVLPGVHKSRATVELEDCDFMYHANQGNYLYYSLNAMGRAVRQGALSGLRGDIADYGVRSLDCLHTGEGFPDDRLEVHTWQPSPEHPLVVNVAICKEDNVIYHALFNFHDKPISS